MERVKEVSEFNFEGQIRGRQKKKSEWEDYTERPIVQEASDSFCEAGALSAPASLAGEVYKGHLLLRSWDYIL